MKMIKFSGMLCSPFQIMKDGDFKIKGIMHNAKDHPPVMRYEHFACKEERDKKYDILVNLLKVEK